ncbi:hypothetical protein J6590_025251 [Homalodisca vitripennis]|nr:hypothetical protein J6590_025251 [Homalodisca vitripennis]
MTKANRRTKKSSIWTSTPVKQKLEHENKMKKIIKDTKKEKLFKKLFHEKEHDKKKTQKTKKVYKTKTSGSSSDDDDDCFCLICLELYSKSKPNEKWIQCMSCKKWAHEICTKGDLFYICHNCESE